MGGITMYLCNFYFDNFVIIGNFDLSFPIYALNNNDINAQLNNIVQKIGLFLR